MFPDNTIFIIGCGGHGRSIADTILTSSKNEIIFFDKNARDNEKILGFHVSKDFSLLNNTKKIIYGIGDNYERQMYYKRFRSDYLIISDQVHIGRDTVISNGDFIGHNAYIGPLVKIGVNTIINTHAVIEHECIIGNHSHISVASIVTGSCNIGDCVFIGAGAIIKDKVSICSHVTIGAGSVVLYDIVESGIYVGSPVKKINDNTKKLNI